MFCPADLVTTDASLRPFFFFLKETLRPFWNGLKGALWHSNAYDCTMVKDVVSFLHYTQHSKVATAIHFMGSI